MLLIGVYRNSENKAAIGYTYEDSTPAPETTNDAVAAILKDDDDDILSDDEVDLGMLRLLTYTS